MPDTPHPKDNALITSILKLLGDSFQGMVGGGEGRHQGPRQKIFNGQILVGLVAHLLQFHGCFSASIRRFFGVDISDAALSLRRKKMGVDIFATVTATALRPLAVRGIHHGSFFKGLRLVGIDGTTWSVINTPAHNARVPKVSTRRGLAAFGKAGRVALVELGTHGPLAAGIGLAAPVLERLPEESLVIVDRLYGHAPFTAQLTDICAARGRHFLVRVRAKLAAPVRETLPDGSAWVEVRVHPTGQPRHIERTIRVREVRVRVFHRTEKTWSEVRLWSSLGPEQASARELAQLYARRWEQELFSKELKIDLRGGDLLGAHTPESAAQEMLARLIAGSLLAGERLQSAPHASGEQAGAVQAAGALRISFAACHTEMTALWMVLATAGNLLDETTIAQLIERTRQQIARDARRRRPRSCQRKVRQPVKKWPRMLAPTSFTSLPLLHLIPFA